MSKSSELRHIFGGNEAFFQGHQTVGARTYDREAPKWTKSDIAIRNLLLRVFPKLATDENQRTSAARWVSVIHLYYRLGYTRGQIAEEIGSSDVKVHGVIRSITRACNGLRADGSGQRSGRRGRPRNTCPKSSTS
jgi:hypothetical protein